MGQLLLVRGGSVFVPGTNGQSMATPLAGKYTPAHMKNGQFVSACWRGTVFCVQGAMKDKTVHLTVWNGRNSEPGNGSADRMSKDMCAGRLCLVGYELDSYMREIKDGAGNAIVLPDGSVYKMSILGLKYEPGTMYMLHHSVKMYRYLFANALDVNNFWSELSLSPDNPNYDANSAKMTEIFAARKAIVFQPGMPTYGRALVNAIPQGAQYMLQPPAGYTPPAKNGAVDTGWTVPAMPGINPAGVAAATAPTAPQGWVQPAPVAPVAPVQNQWAPAVAPASPAAAAFSYPTI